LRTLSATDKDNRKAERKAKLCETLNDAITAGLSYDAARTASPSDSVNGVLLDLKCGPVLVLDGSTDAVGQSDRLVGIVTAFDVL
jgi:hypothetical protein